MITRHQLFDTKAMVSSTGRTMPPEGVDTQSDTCQLPGGVLKKTHVNFLPHWGQ